MKIDVVIPARTMTIDVPTWQIEQFQQDPIDYLQPVADNLASEYGHWYWEQIG